MGESWHAGGGSHCHASSHLSLSSSPLPQASLAVAVVGSVSVCPFSSSLISGHSSAAATTGRTGSVRLGWASGTHIS